MIHPRFHLISLAILWGATASAQGNPCMDHWLNSGRGQAAEVFCEIVTQANANNIVPLLKKKNDCPTNGPSSMPAFAKKPKCNPSSIILPGFEMGALIWQGANGGFSVNVIEKKIDGQWVDVRRGTFDGVATMVESTQTDSSDGMFVAAGDSLLKGLDLDWKISAPGNTKSDQALQEYLRARANWAYEAIGQGDTVYYLLQTDD